MSRTSNPYAIQPLVLAGIACVVTSGCMLGAVALLGISARHSYVAPEWSPYIMAHANSQLMGWCGLFVMAGVLWLLHSEGTHVSPKAPVVLSFGMARAIALRFTSEILLGRNIQYGEQLGLASAILEAALASLFLVTVLPLLLAIQTETRRTVTRLWLVPALVLWVASACYEPWVFYCTHLQDPATLVMFIARCFVPLREVQFSGFAAGAITALLLCFNIPIRIPPFWVGTGGALWLTGVLVRAHGWIAGMDGMMRAESMHAYHVGGAIWAAGLCMASALLFIQSARNPGHKHNSAVYSVGIALTSLWALTAATMTLVEPGWLAKLGVPFSHAYTGAIRHALTVGFISQGILLYEGQQIGLWHKYGVAGSTCLLLLNSGNLLRVYAETATDVNQAAFGWMAPSGMVEMTGVLLWSALIIYIQRNDWLRANHPILAKMPETA